ncbi:SulP family inorganic anion transporter [Qipengyuania sp. ASV99]|uniref:SulP family inorganic anion transporter n=1 Tax=Qipengyuania sp. ASV99 TaxID=3399681 RepID=UPI003A4C7D94
MQPKILTTMRDYSPALFVSDALAGLTVAMVAIPLSIAIAIASGADPAKGLVTAVIGGLLISLLGGSRVQIGGPTGAFIVVVFGVIADHGYDGLVLATAMAGVILIVAGWLRAGRLIALVPEAVVNGFTIGIALIIAFSQLGDLLGLDLRGVPADLAEKAPAIWAARGDINPLAVVTGIAAMVLIVVLRRAFPRFPGLVVAMAVVSAGVMLAAMPVETIAGRYGELPRALPWPSVPDITFAKVAELLPSALVIAFLAAVESLLSAMVADRMIGSQHRPNAEVSAQGWANLGSALFGGMPATGAIARTATNVNAGGKTPVAGVLHAAFILLIMLAAAPLAGYLALPALAGLLLITAWNMSEPHKWRSYWAAPVADRALLLLTLLLTVAADLTIAIGTGVALGLLLRLSKSRKLFG